MSTRAQVAVTLLACALTYALLWTDAAYSLRTLP